MWIRTCAPRPPAYQCAWRPGRWQPINNVRHCRVAVNSHRYVSIYETLTALYPSLSMGGFVVFDDWKFVQARGAIMVRCCRIGMLIPVTPRGAGAPGAVTRPVTCSVARASVLLHSCLMEWQTRVPVRAGLSPHSQHHEHNHEFRRSVLLEATFSDRRSNGVLAKVVPDRVEALTFPKKKTSS